MNFMMETFLFQTANFYRIDYNLISYSVVIRKTHELAVHLFSLIVLVFPACIQPALGIGLYYVLLLFCSIVVSTRSFLRSTRLAGGQPATERMFAFCSIFCLYYLQTVGRVSFSKVLTMSSA